MYARLLQGYEAMEPELQVASASAARQLRLMVSLRKGSWDILNTIIMNGLYFEPNNGIVGVLK